MKQRHKITREELKRRAEMEEPLIKRGRSLTVYCDIRDCVNNIPSKNRLFSGCCERKHILITYAMRGKMTCYYYSPRLRESL